MISLPLNSILNRMHGRGARDTGVLCALLLLAVGVTAQPMPTIKSVSPDVLQLGVTTHVTVAGENIADASQVLITGPAGLTASIKPVSPSTKPAKEVTIEIAADKSAPRGPRELRLVTKNGATKPHLLWIDDLPPVAEKEPNNSPGEAQPITLPAIITGKIQAELDVDCFRFDAKKGQRLIFDVQAYRTGSKLDGSLTLLDAAGRRVAHDEDTNGLDPLIDFTVPADGQYTLHLQDLQYKGGPDFAYRIRAGEIPYVDAIFPLGGQRGQQVAVELKGRNLAGTRTMSMSLDAADPAPTREIEAPTSAGHLANPLKFAVSDLPEFNEPQDNSASPIALASLPVIVNGKIAKANETDVYRFTTPAAGSIVLEIAAARLGSRLDALLTLTDDKGAVLQRNDDAAPAGADARVQFTAEAKKTYQVKVRDLTEKGGDAYGYRLSISPPRPVTPDFDVTLHGADALRLNRGGRAALWATVTRRGNFAGDVTVSLWPLPPGVTCRPLRVSATQPSSGVFTLTAAQDATPGFHPLNVVATGQVGEDVITKPAAVDPKLKVVPQAYLSVVEPAPFRIERVGPPPATDPRTRDAKIAELQKRLATPTPELQAAQAKWEKSVNLASAWEILDVIDAKASSSIKLVKQPDGSLRAEGRVPSVDKYTVIARVAQPNVRAIRLEAIADGTVGPGRAENGNFVLNTFKVGLLPMAAAPKAPADPASATPVELASATADFSQAGFDVADSIAGKPNGGWAVAPEMGKTHVATYRLKSPILPTGNGQLVFTLDHNTTFARHIIGHFRLLITAAEKPDDNTKVPAAVLATLKIPAQKRTKADADALAAFYRSIAPELAKTRDELASLKTAGGVFPPVVNAGATAKLDVLLARTPGFTGDVTLTVEGFSTGLDEKTKLPAPFTKNFDFTPLTVKANQSVAVLDLKPKATSERGTRDAVLRAESNTPTGKWVTYSAPFPITVK